MRVLRMSREIAAPVDRCFRLALSVDLQAEVLATFGLAPAGGTTQGLLGPNGTVVWRRRRLGLTREYTVSLQSHRAPLFFREVQTGGGIASYVHDRHFATMNDGTLLREELRFSLGWGALGRLREGRMLRRLLRLLNARNDAVQRAAEGDGWMRYLQSGGAL